MLHVDPGQRVLARDVETASTPLRRMKGLLGRTTVPAGYALVIRPCSSIHTWFMQCPIDAVFVDRDGRVVKVAHDVRPFRLVAGGFRAHAVVELESGAAARAALQPGDRVTGFDGLDAG